jgi:hypothetical protein
MSQSTRSEVDVEDLRERIVRSLRAQGFRVRNGAVLPPKDLSKERIRELHETAVAHRIERARDGLFRMEKDLLRHIASGHEVVPSRIFPRLVEVLPDSEEELLFRYASLHWSIPVSSGYGRRLRFLVVDEYNGKLIGLIGLGDPVFSLGPRDRWIGWTPSDRKKRLGNVMDAFVLGAVPPYSFLLCGKLVAMLAASDTVRRAFKRKYGGTRSVIRQHAPEAKSFVQAKAHRHRPLSEAERGRNRTKSKVRAKVEQVFLVIKRIFGWAKVRYRGLAKNTNWLFVTCGLANRYVARRRLLAGA